MAELWGIAVPDAVLALGIFLGSILLARAVIAVIDAVIRPLVTKTKTQLDDFLFAAIKNPLTAFFALFGAYFAIASVNPAFEAYGFALDRIFGLSLILAGGYAAASVASALMKWYMTDIGIGEKSRIGEIFPILSKIVKLLVYFATLVILLSELGVEIGPLIAGLGVAGLAVALALQESLKNFFAGVYILADKPIRRGDFIALDAESSDIKGWVREIGWRSTRIRTREGHNYMVPNEKLASSVLINYDRSRAPKRVAAIVGAEYGTDPDRVFAALKDACKKTVESLQTAVKDEAPIIRQTKYADSSIEYKAIIFVKNYLDTFEAESELNRQIYKAFRRHNLTVPFPIRTLYLHEKKGGKTQKKERTNGP